MFKEQKHVKTHAKTFSESFIERFHGFDVHVNDLERCAHSIKTNAHARNARAEPPRPAKHKSENAVLSFFASFGFTTLSLAKAAVIAGFALGFGIVTFASVGTQTPYLTANAVENVQVQQAEAASRAGGREPLDAVDDESLNGYFDVTLITVNGERKVQTTGKFVRDVLKEQNISLGFNDSVYPDQDAKVTNHMLILVGEITQSTKTEKEKLAFNTKKVDDYDLKVGEEKVSVAGVEGEVNNTYVIHEINGAEVSRSVVDSEVIKKPTDEVISVGNYDENAVNIDPNSAKGIAKSMIAEYGWGDGQFQALDMLWTRESGWSTSAHNPTTGAHGIPQALPGSKMASAGPNWQSNATTQIRWGLGYIKGRYGSPAAAWAFFSSNGYY
ncbi:MAG: G5 domain-containing protein [Bifidobacteriaceae bacterium]|jgi:hypothetical protein|nr:G5 domain-containing protein [Bifidobacteriaceae bacterium]